MVVVVVVVLVVVLVVDVVVAATVVGAAVGAAAAAIVVDVVDVAGADEEVAADLSPSDIASDVGVALPSSVPPHAATVMATMTGTTSEWRTGRNLTAGIPNQRS